MLSWYASARLLFSALRTTQTGGFFVGLRSLIGGPEGQLSQNPHYTHRPYRKPTPPPPAPRNPHSPTRHSAGCPDFPALYIYPRQTNLGRRERHSPRDPPPPKIVLDRDSLSTQVCSASDQLTATQLIRVQGSASPFVVGRGARGGAEWGCVDSEFGRSAAAPRCEHAPA
jgi:hypothetical protein